MDTGVWVWWLFLIVVSVLNLFLWGWSAWTLWYQSKADPHRFRVRWPHAVLSLGFVAGCALRSFFPKGDVQRIVLVDSWMSSIFVGRTIATVAELCFVAQWALLIREIAARTNAPFTHASARAIVPCIVLAEISSWYAVISTNYLGNTIEESLWTVCFTGITAGAVALWRYSSREFRPILAAGALAGSFYTLFMMFVDVPMYWNRWQADEAAGRSYLSISHGVYDALFTRRVTGAWQDWSGEIPWMSLYFSAAVWLSIAVIHLKPFSESLNRSVSKK